jgi:methylmalonyl-CoA mutase N-terminal domain/subunit
MSSADLTNDRDQLAAKERELAALRSEVAAWRERFGKLPIRDDSDFTSVSGRRVEPVYTPLDLAPDILAQGILPGRFPYTRGVHPSGYRGKLWTMRQFADRH